MRLRPASDEHSPGSERWETPFRPQPDLSRPGVREPDLVIMVPHVELMSRSSRRPAPVRLHGLGSTPHGSTPAGAGPILHRHRERTPDDQTTSPTSGNLDVLLAPVRPPILGAAVRMVVGTQNVDQIIVRCRWATTEYRQVELYVTGDPFAHQPTDPDHPSMRSRQVWTEARENEPGSQSSLSGRCCRGRRGQ